MGIFNFDSPFMSFLGKAVEYMLVSILCLIFCIPIITIGAAVTAEFYVGMRLVRGEDTPFFRAYIKSFKENFRQSTVVWIIEMLVGGFLAFDWYLIYKMGGDNFNQIFKILLIIVTLYVVLAGIAVFALLARFEMATIEAIKGALAYTYVNIPRMILVLVLLIFPFAASFRHFDWLMALWPVGSAASLYVISYNFVTSFKKLELRVQGIEEEDETKETEENE